MRPGDPGGGVDVVIDPVGGHHSEPALRALGRFGRFCVIGFASGPIASVPLESGPAQQPHRDRCRLGERGPWAISGGNREVLAELVALVEGGRLHPTVPTERPLAEAAAVMAGLLDRSLAGKVVLVP